MINQIDRIYDELLVIKCKQGKKLAFEELVSRWQEQMWRYAFKLTGSDADAWDAIQETWCEIIRGLLKLRDTASFPCWLFKILNNKCSDLLRKKQQQSRLSKEFSEHREMEVGSPKNNNVQIEFIYTLIDGLSTDRQALLMLRYFNNFNTNQIAEILDIPEGTVKSRLSRTVEKLREIMRQK